MADAEQAFEDPARPPSLPLILDRLHDIARRRDLAYHQAARAEVTYERKRADAIRYLVDNGESVAAAERQTRADFSDEYRFMVEARAELSRLEALHAHFAFLATHHPDTPT